jgi:hypothetical protein
VGRTGSSPKEKETGGLYFRMDTALKRVQKMGDLFSEVLTLKQNLPKSFVTHLDVKTPSSLNVYAKSEISQRPRNRHRRPFPAVNKAAGDAS